MTMQDVTTPPTFNPHGGPITHSSTGLKPDSLVHPVSRLSLALGFVCNSWATFRVIYSGITHNTWSHCSETFHTLFHAMKDCLSARNFSWYLLTSLSIFSKVSIRELLSTTFPDVIYQVVNLARVRSPGIPLLFFRKYDEDPEGRMTNLSRCPKTDN